MTSWCSPHWWVIWQERWDRGPHRVRVRCHVCGKKTTWPWQRAVMAQNYAWWLRQPEHSSRSS